MDVCVQLYFFTWQQSLLEPPIFVVQSLWKETNRQFTVNSSEQQEMKAFSCLLFLKVCAFLNKPKNSTILIAWKIHVRLQVRKNQNTRKILVQNSAANWSSAYEYIEQIDYIRKTILKQAHSNWIVIINSGNQIYINFFTNVYFNHFFSRWYCSKRNRIICSSSFWCSTGIVSHAWSLISLANFLSIQGAIDFTRCRYLAQIWNRLICKTEKHVIH